MKIAAASLLLIAASGPTAADGYRYERTEFERTTINLTVKFHPSYAALREAGRAAGISSRAAAWSTFYLENNDCTIHLLEPRVSYRPEAAGHELIHCLRGRWHGQGDDD